MLIRDTLAASPEGAAATGAGGITLQPISPPLKPSTLVLPHGHWCSLLEGLCHHFPAISREVWLSRFARDLVLDSQQRPLAPEDPHLAGSRIYYFREVANERVIPFTETILYQDEHLLVVDKPHFLPVIPSGTYVTQTLLSRLMARLGNSELQPLHRIDRHTAGLVLFSVQKRSRARYQALFREQQIEKRYEALASPLPQLTFPHIRSSRIERGERFFLSQEVPGCVNAQSRIEVLERRDELWRYELNPITGKKHQLRLHMAALGAPIRNDALYPVVDDALAEDYSRPLQLLARDMGFVDPMTGQQRHFRSRLILQW